MKAIETAIPGVVVLEPTLYPDARGYFFECYRDEWFREHVAPITFVQENESRSSYGVLRGLHYQRAPHAQSKLVRVVEGCVLDVAVDLRKESTTYGKYVAVELSGENHRQLFLPQGFAHGFVTLSPYAILHYKCDAYYCPTAEGSVRWCDPTLGIDWQLPEADLILSDKDRTAPLFRSLQAE